MANPIHLIEENATFLAKGREPYPVWFRPYTLGKTETVEAISCWEFSDEEIATVNDTGVVFLRVVEVQPPVCLFNASPTEFEGQSANYRHPDCLDLPTLIREVMFDSRKTIDITSAWQLNPQGLRFLNENRYLVLAVVGGMTDVEVFGINPIE